MNMIFQLTQLHKDAIFDINENLAKSTKLSLRLLLPHHQLFITCYVSEHETGYIKYDTTKNEEPSKTYAPAVFVLQDQHRTDVIHYERQGSFRHAVHLWFMGL